VINAASFEATETAKASELEQKNRHLTGELGALKRLRACVGRESRRKAGNVTLDGGTSYLDGGD
jgi:hypothetical protein